MELAWLDVQFITILIPTSTQFYVFCVLVHVLLVQTKPLAFHVLMAFSFMQLSVKPHVLPEPR